MREKDANDKVRDLIRAQCPGARVYKINDRQTKAIPDTVVTWDNCTSWLEFKMLEGDANIHASAGPRFRLQLIELVRLEQQCHRAWVVAYRKATRTAHMHLTIYRPTALLELKQPFAKEESLHINLLRDLRTHGVAELEGFDHAAVVALIKQTHASY